MPPIQATDLLSLTPDELGQALAEHFETRGQPPYRSAQVKRWIYEGLAPSIEDMTDLPFREREALRERFACGGSPTAS
jgi:adenine C2-methylase RlmN of 23S rRNA A2503 and tRNA A37